MFICSFTPNMLRTHWRNHDTKDGFYDQFQHSGHSDKNIVHQKSCKACKGNVKASSVPILYFTEKCLVVSSALKLW